MTAYRRGSGGSKDLTVAAAAGLVAGSVAFYLARIWFRREPIGDVDRPSSREEGDLPEDESSPAPDRPSDSAPR